MLVLAEWDRCTRSMTDGIAIIERVHRRGAFVKVLDRDYLDLSKPINRGILAFLSALAEDERHRILRRANEGRVEARKRGVHMGRKPKLTDHQQAEALQRLAKGETYRAIARSMAVHLARSAGWRVTAQRCCIPFEGFPNMCGTLVNTRFAGLFGFDPHGFCTGSDADRPVGTGGLDSAALAPRPSSAGFGTNLP
jgi:hypothetical protein